MARKKKLSWFDWLIILFFIALALTPDFSDALDVGLPIIEPALAYMYYNIRTRGRPW